MSTTCTRYKNNKTNYNIDQYKVNFKYNLMRFTHCVLNKYEIRNIITQDQLEVVNV